MSGTERALLMLCLAGCAGSPAPRGTVPDAVDGGRSAYGGWTEVEFKQHGKRYRVEGELIAVSSDSIYIAGEDSLMAHALNRIERGRVVWYEGHPGKITAGSAVGSLTTVANGAFLVITMPLWWIAGATGSHKVVDEMSQRIATSQGAQLRAFARFPGGLPEGIDRGALRPFGQPGRPSGRGRS